MENIQNCPVCGSPDSTLKFKAKDYTVTNEMFHIVTCDSCRLIYTNPRPAANEAGPYYHATAYISHSDTNEGIVNKLYHAVRKITLKSKTSWIEPEKKGNKELLDIGCGNGHFLAAAKERGWNINGVELDPETAARATKLTGIDIAPALREIATEKKFQVITLWHVLEHVYELDDYFQFFKNRLETDGKLLLALPNPASFDANYFKEYWAAYDVPRHIYHFTPETISALAAKYGFKLKKSRGLIFDSFYISLLSNEYKSGNKRLIHSFFIGLISNLRAMLGRPNYSSNLYLFEHA
ncbi:class I SAM-dependent methyltransferase [Aquirufa sp. HETE-83D]|uniref:Class I SAM-dependent methyltransferase n=1 Tax=Aquirufa esocilacus TaxID=3096513 RepID=A0ABW6DME9_9BACT